MYIIGCLHLKQNDYKKAYQFLTEYLSYCEDDIGYHKLSLALFESGSLKNAYVHIQGALAIAPYNSVYLRLKSQILWSMGEEDLSMEVLDFLIEKFDYNLNKDHAILAEAMDIRGKRIDALEILKNQINIDPNNSMLQTSLGLMYYSDEDYTEANNIFSKAYKIDRTNLMALFLRGQTLNLMRRDQSGCPDMKKAVLDGWEAGTSDYSDQCD